MSLIIVTPDCRRVHRHAWRSQLVSESAI